MKSDPGLPPESTSEPTHFVPALRHWRTAGRLTQSLLTNLGMSPSRPSTRTALGSPPKDENSKIAVAESSDLHSKVVATRAEMDPERESLAEGPRARASQSEPSRSSHGMEEREPSSIGSLPIAFYTADVNWQFSGPRFLSDGFASAVGYEADAFIENRDLWASRIHPDDLARVWEQLEHIGDTNALSVEYRWHCADGSERTFLDQARLARDANGAPKEIIGACIDVTYRAQIEHELLQSRKIEAIARLTDGLAHDLNNNLSVITWNLDLLSRLFKGTGKDFERVQNAMAGAENCTDLLNRLLIFARQKSGDPIVLDPRELITAAGQRAGTMIGDKIKIDIKLPDDIRLILADPTQMESALFSLASNGKDAMPDGGTLTYECANVGKNAGSVLPQDGLSYVVISVTDTGTGMPQDVVDRAFEPFFTTKAAGKGSGLGLSMVYGFITQSGGYVKIDSVPGVGTTVRLYLPETSLPLQGKVSSNDSSAPVALPPDKSLPTSIAIGN